MMTINAKATPALLSALREAIERGEEEITLVAIDAVSVPELTRLMEGRGFRVRFQDDDGLLSLTAVKGAAIPWPRAPAPQEAPVSHETLRKMPSALPAAPLLPRDARGLTLILMGTRLGRGNPDLEELLIKDFLAGMAQTEIPPDTVILLNEGVRLARFDTSTCDHLKDMETKGSHILVSDLCAGELGLTGDIGVGVIANRFDILDAIYKAKKIFEL